MKLTDILGKFNDFRLLTNFDIEEISVSNVTVIDAPDSPIYSVGGEFILTSGFMFKDDISMLEKVIRDSKNAGCAAIGIKLGRFLITLPDSTIELANNLQMPIINIPVHYPYTGIINPLLSDILSKNLEDMKFVENMQNDFMMKLFKGASLEELVKFLHDIIGEYVDFTNYFDNKVYTFGNKKDDGQFAKTLIGRTMKIGKLAVGIRESDFSYRVKMTINYAIIIFSIKIEQSIVIANTREKYLSDFISDLLAKNWNTKEEVRTRASLLNKDLGGEFFVCVFDIDKFKRTIVHYPTKNHKIEGIKEEMFQKIVQILRQSGYNIHYFKKSDSIICIIQNKNKSILEEKYQITELKQTIDNYFSNLNTLTITVGIGMITDIFNIHKSYNEALDCINIGRSLKEQGGVFLYCEIEFFKYIKQSIDKDNSTYFYHDFEKVIEYSKNSDYLLTLISLIENGWSIRKAAEKLYMHYNTVKYRYDKLEELTGRDFSKPDDRFMMELAYRYYKLRDK